MSRFDWLHDPALWVETVPGRLEFTISRTVFCQRSCVAESDWKLELLAWRCRQLVTTGLMYEVTQQADEDLLCFAKDA
ncbi:hypothetical protein [Stenotrophomonas sp. NPDC077659]|uniref:hypothetical protein n=1 Tax=Stenotrophomonas sp. NPDC077659 TaxID=3390694 RepID=UPI003D02868F